MDMNKRILIGFAALTFSAISFAGTPNNMQVWLKNGEQKAFDINEVDSVTFGVTPQITYESLTENTMPPTFAAPNPLMVNKQELAYIRANNQFAMDCYAKVRKMTDQQDPTEPRPIHFFSPVSLNIALGFCANGATTDGAKEITQALGFPSLKDMNNFYQKLFVSLNSNVDSVDIHTANALWINEGNKVYEDFVETAKKKYYATVRHLDFENDPVGSKDTINHWAALMTNDRIKSLGIKITPLTRLVINNACYFKADWKIPFESAGKRIFNGAYGKKGQTDFMSFSLQHAQCAQTDMYQAIKLDYTGSELGKYDTAFASTYSMIIVLPNEESSIDKVLPTLQWDSIPLTYKKCDLTMPKFESRGNYQLVGTMKESNINDIFKRYPNAIKIEQETDSIHISQIAQDYFLKVDEKGTEAAVVTSIVGELTGLPPEPQFVMNCNRPFVFAIRENSTGLILFMGEYDFVPEKE